jgi:nitrogen fixation protein FixH
MRDRSATRSAWNLFPWAIAAGMLVVVAVNAGMVFSALQTFPGKAGRDGFDLSNRYNKVIDRVQEQASLGWTIHTEVDAKSRPIVRLTASVGGTPLVNPHVLAVARRPVGDPRDTDLLFEHVGNGRYVAATPLTAQGQWDLMLTITSQSREMMTTRRIIVP